MKRNERNQLRQLGGKTSRYWSSKLNFTQVNFCRKLRNNSFTVNEIMIIAEDYNNDINKLIDDLELIQVYYKFEQRYREDKLNYTEKLVKERLKERNHD